MKIKAVICDVGGVLIQSGDTRKRRAWEDRFGLLPGELANIVYQVEPGGQATVGRIKFEDIWQDIRRRFHLTNEEEIKLCEDFYSGDVLNEEFYNYIKRISKKYKTALLSNAWENARVVYSKKFHLDELFTVMVISAEVGMQKPDKKIFQYTLDLLGVSPSEALFIDDTLENCISAEKVGLHAIMFADTKIAIANIKKILLQ